MLWQRAGQCGWLQLNLLAPDGFQQEEHLVFTACTDADVMLDGETCDRLFQLPASTQPTAEPIPEVLQGNARRQLDAALSRALEQSDQFFSMSERDKLNAWAEDCAHAAEQT